MLVQSIKKVLPLAHLKKNKNFLKIDKKHKCAPNASKGICSIDKKNTKILTL
jgi:hypothetical protein